MELEGRLKAAEVLHKRLEEIRKLLGLNKTDFGKKYMKWYSVFSINPKMMPNLWVVLNIANDLGISLDEVIGTMPITPLNNKRLQEKGLENVRKKLGL